MKRIFAPYLMLAFFLLGGCAKKEPTTDNNKIEEKREQLFRMNIHSEMATIDPRLSRDIPSVTSSKMLFDGLMRMSDTGPLFSIAKSVTLSEDKTVYTFLLRPSLWSDKTEVTAYDFEYSWKSVLDPHFPAEYAHQLFIIKNGKAAKEGLLSLNEVGVRALDDYTLEVTLEHPDPYFLELVAFPICYPVSKLADEHNPHWAEAQGEGFVCNGPFKLLHWRHSSELIALRNPLYWDKESVKLDKIILTMVEDEHTELNMYENDELDWAGSPNSTIPPEALSALKIEKPEQLHILPIAGTYCYKFNTEKEPFTSAKIRRAFSMAIDRKALIDNILQANQLVAHALIPPCMQVENPKQYVADNQQSLAVEIFEEGLKELGLTKETLPPITLIFSRSEKHEKVAQAVQQQWNATFGIKVSLQSYEWNTFINKLNRGEYQVGGRGWVSDLSDPYTLLAIYKSLPGSSNDTRWYSEEFTRLLEEAVRCTDNEKRLLMLKQAEAILMDERPIAPLYHSTACYLKKPYVKDVYLSKLCDLDLKKAYCER